jgi:hypothetical protein
MPDDDDQGPVVFAIVPEIQEVPFPEIEDLGVLHAGYQLVPRFLERFERLERGHELRGIGRHR